MSKRFIIAVESESPNLRDSFTQHLATLGCGYWHWIGNVWLVEDPRPGQTPELWRNEAWRFFPGETVFVTEVPPGSGWSAWSSQEAIDWLNQVWYR